MPYLHFYTHSFEHSILTDGLYIEVIYENAFDEIFTEHSICCSFFRDFLSYFIIERFLLFKTRIMTILSILRRAIKNVLLDIVTWV